MIIILCNLDYYLVSPNSTINTTSSSAFGSAKFQELVAVLTITNKFMVFVSILIPTCSLMMPFGGMRFHPSVVAMGTFLLMCCRS